MDEPEDSAATFGLVLPFDSDEPEFTRGFEAGSIWARLGFEESFECYLHPENTEMVMRIAEAKGVAFSARPEGDEWLWVTFRPKEPATPSAP